MSSVLFFTVFFEGERHDLSKTGGFGRKMPPPGKPVTFYECHPEDHAPAPSVRADLNSFIHISLVTSLQCGVESVECGVWSGKCRVWSVKCKVWSVKCKVWSVKCKVWSVKCKVWSVKCKVWSVKCKV